MEEQRYTHMLNCLPEAWAPYDVLLLLYGVERDDSVLWGDFLSWSKRLRQPREVVRSESVNRHDFETFMQQNSLLSLKIAAARLGMTRNSFVSLLVSIENAGGVTFPIRGISSEVVFETILRSIREYFPELRHGIFGGHTNYCVSLHRAINSKFGFEVEPLLCVTSRALGEPTIKFAHDYDCLSGDPVGLQYQVWLNFGKPIYLKPDICSLKLYSEHEADLTPYLMAGRRPEIPEELRHTVQR